MGVFSEILCHKRLVKANQYGDVDRHGITTQQQNVPLGEVDIQDNCNQQGNVHAKPPTFLHLFTVIVLFVHLQTKGICAKNVHLFCAVLSCFDL